MSMQFKMPPYLGRLPTLMGIPAGGSLTADQWLLMATVVGPIAVCCPLVSNEPKLNSNVTDSADMA